MTCSLCRYWNWGTTAAAQPSSPSWCTRTCTSHLSVSANNHPWLANNHPWLGNNHTWLANNHTWLASLCRYWNWGTTAAAQPSSPSWWIRTCTSHLSVSANNHPWLGNNHPWLANNH